MARTIQDVLNEARKLLLDTRVGSYRYSDDYLIGLLNSAMQELYTVRPDAYVGCCTDADIAVPVYTVGQLAPTPPDVVPDFPVDGMFFQPVVYHIVGSAQLADDEFANDNRAMTLLAAFRQQLRGG